MCEGYSFAPGNKYAGTTFPPEQIQARQTTVPPGSTREIGITSLTLEAKARISYAFGVFLLGRSTSKYNLQLDLSSRVSCTGE